MPKSRPQAPPKAPSSPTRSAPQTCPTRCTITSRTVATTPPNRARTRIGVGETVSLTVDPGPAQWSVRGPGDLSTNEGTTVDYRAPDRAATVTIVAERAGCSCSITLEVVEPQSVVMQRMPGTGKRHRRGQASTGMITEIWILPADVSFASAQFREREVDATGTGCFEAHFRSNSVPHGANTDWWEIETVDARGSKILGYDRVYFEASSCGGTIAWAIPYEFRVDYGTPKVFTTVQQVGTFTADGHATATKAGASVSSSRNDPTERDPRF